MSQTQKKRLKLYAIVAAVSITILAVSLTGGLYAKLQPANGNSVSTSNDNIPDTIHYADTNSKGEAQATNIVAPPPNESSGDSLQIVVSGSASKKINPDKVSITLGVETQEKTAKEAASKNADSMNAIIKELKALGLSESEISTSYYNIYPVYEYPKPIPSEIPIPSIPIPPNNNPTLVGYKAANTITITTSADINVGEIIDAATDSGANQVQGINFFVSEEVQRQMNQELIEQAVLDAKTKAERALAPLNMQIVGVKNINLNDVYIPVYSYATELAQGAPASPAPTPVLPSQQQVSASISVTFMIGSK